jgi:hypothetical protein
VKEPSVLVGSDAKSGKAPSASRQEVQRRVGALVGWLGWVLLISGGADFALSWYPMNFGTPEWEYATVTSSFNVLPLILLGLGLVVVGASATGRRWWSIPVAIVAAGMLLFLLFAGMVWATNVPIALGAAQGAALTGLKKAIARTSVQLVVYAPLLTFISWRAVWVTRAGRPQ